jgi:hypothetical protein
MQFNTMSIGRSNLRVDNLAEEGHFVLCRLLFLVDFRNCEEELSAALTNTKGKIRDL